MLTWGTPRFLSVWRGPSGRPLVRGRSLPAPPGPSNLSPRSDLTARNWRRALRTTFMAAPPNALPSKVTAEAGPPEMGDHNRAGNARPHAKRRQWQCFRTGRESTRGGRISPVVGPVHARESASRYNHPYLPRDTVPHRLS